MQGLRALGPADLAQGRFETLVFAGGGNRCWWQAGVIEQLREQRCWQVRRLVGASAGAAIAAAFVAGRLQQALVDATARLDGTPRNIEWTALLRGRRPFMMPRVYREWLCSFLDEAALAALRTSELQLELVVTRPVPLLPVSLSTLLALGLYAGDKFLLKGLHSRWPQRLGLRAEHLLMADSRSLGEAREWLLASAAAVPLTPVYRVLGKPALDGGFHDAVPLPQGEARPERTLVLLTRHRRALPQLFSLGGRTYLQPRRPVEAVNMDCTSGANVQRAYAQGAQEAAGLLGLDATR